MVNSSAGCCSTAYQNKLLYIQLHGIKQLSSRNKSARKTVVTSLLKKKKKKDKTKQKAKASKTFGIPLCKQANKNKRTGRGVGTILFPVHVTFPNHDLLARVSN